VPGCDDHERALPELEFNLAIRPGLGHDAQNLAHPVGQQSWFRRADEHLVQRQRPVRMFQQVRLPHGFAGQVFGVQERCFREGGGIPPDIDEPDRPGL
jgi:hypothetical protein